MISASVMSVTLKTDATPVWKKRHVGIRIFMKPNFPSLQIAPKVSTARPVWECATVTTVPPVTTKPDSAAAPRATPARPAARPVRQVSQP